MPNNTQLLADRRSALREMLLTGTVATQRALVEALQGRGFVATQSGVSRDLKELGVVKTSRGYELPSASLTGDDEIAKVADLLREIKPAGPHLLIIKTAIGAAQRVALALDRTGWPEIVGNVGGDDTILAATVSAAAQNQIIARINHFASHTQGYGF